MEVVRNAEVRIWRGISRIHLPESCSLGVGQNEGSKPLKQPMDYRGRRASVAHSGLQGAEPVLSLKNCQRTVHSEWNDLEYEVVNPPPPPCSSRRWGIIVVGDLDF